jgi:hypothetical protein
MVSKSSAEDTLMRRKSLTDLSNARDRAKETKAAVKLALEASNAVQAIVGSSPSNKVRRNRTNRSNKKSPIKLGETGNTE